MAESTTKSYLPPGLAVPMPSPDGVDKGFYEGLKRHELTVQCCNKCHTFQFAPELICHKCQSADLGWQKVSGRGRLYSWIRIWNPVHPALKTACPYIVAVVELPDADGVRMVGNLSGDPMQDVPFDSEVEAVFEEHPEQGSVLVQWRPVGS
ncbi:MAG: Zn-ribbon domain-containing OB-fold protein [Candidatus Binataceae bacterium]